MSNDQKQSGTWIDHLDDADTAFVKRFMLASGSLKEMAKIYGITYPTVRLRLDRLIEKIKVLDSHLIASPFERIARAKYAEGKIDLDTLKALLSVHLQELETHREKPDRQ